MGRQVVVRQDCMEAILQKYVLSNLEVDPSKNLRRPLSTSWDDRTRCAGCWAALRRTREESREQRWALRLLGMRSQDCKHMQGAERLDGGHREQNPPKEQQGGGIHDENCMTISMKE